MEPPKGDLKSRFHPGFSHISRLVIAWNVSSRQVYTITLNARLIYHAITQFFIQCPFLSFEVCPITFKLINSFQRIGAKIQVALLYIGGVCQCDSIKFKVALSCLQCLQWYQEPQQRKNLITFRFLYFRIFDASIVRHKHLLSFLLPLGYGVRSKNMKPQAMKERIYYVKRWMYWNHILFSICTPFLLLHEWGQIIIKK